LPLSVVVLLPHKGLCPLKSPMIRYEQMCRENLQTEMIRNSTDPILKFKEKVISIADETIPKTSTNQLCQIYTVWVFHLQ
jgi:hypothetical protein